MQRDCDVAIIGAGSAGLAAAAAMTGRGLDICLLDENHHVGGQLLRKPTAAASRGLGFEMDGARRRGFRLIDRLAHRGVGIHRGVQVLGLFPENRILVQSANGRVFEMAARCVVCATGARERFIPFPGLTLPGVISTGAAQVLLKSSGMVPAGATLIGGSGPLPFLLARQLLSKGGKVAALLNHATFTEMLRFSAMLPRHPAKLVDGVRSMAALLTAGVPVYSGCRIVEARGRDRLESVTVARRDHHGGVLAGTERSFRVDCLAVGFGFTPNIELLLQAGCTAVHMVDHGGWVIQTDARLETSVSGLFAAGEVTGIAGGAKSLVEGRLCGLSVLEHLGAADMSVELERQRLHRRRREEVAFGAAMNRLCYLPRDWATTIPDDTIICRCEKVRLGYLRRRIAEGFRSFGALKKATRSGMGRCQGRICSSLVADISAIQGPSGVGTERPASTRAPVKMVPLGALAAMQKEVPRGT